MAGEDPALGASGSGRDPHTRPEERLSGEIDELLALRRLEANPHARRPSWEEVSRPLVWTGRRLRTRRLDAHIAALAILSVIGCGLLILVLMGGSGDQTPRGQFGAFVATLTPEPTQIAVVQPSETPTTATSATA